MNEGEKAFNEFVQRDWHNSYHSKVRNPNCRYCKIEDEPFDLQPRIGYFTKALEESQIP